MTDRGSNTVGFSAVALEVQSLWDPIAESLTAAGAIVHIVSRIWKRCDSAAAKIAVTHGICRAVDVDMTDSSEGSVQSTPTNEQQYELAAYRAKVRAGIQLSTLGSCARFLRTVDEDPGAVDRTPSSSAQLLIIGR